MAHSSTVWIRCLTVLAMTGLVCQMGVRIASTSALGPGGMGTAYRARHRKLDRPVAVKVLHAHLQEDPSFAERFIREARTLARLDHPNIVRVYDSGHREGINYLVMEFVEGVTLRQTMALAG